MGRAGVGVEIPQPEAGRPPPPPLGPPHPQLRLQVQGERGGAVPVVSSQENLITIKWYKETKDFTYRVVLVRFPGHGSQPGTGPANALLHLGGGGPGVGTHPHVLGPELGLQINCLRTASNSD